MSTYGVPVYYPRARVLGRSAWSDLGYGVQKGSKKGSILGHLLEAIFHPISPRCQKDPYPGLKLVFGLVPGHPKSPKDPQKGVQKGGI